MKSYLVLAAATTVALVTVAAFPLSVDRVAASGDYAIRVHASGAYSDDGVIVPVFEALEARYAAANTPSATGSMIWSAEAQRPVDKP